VAARADGRGGHRDRLGPGHQLASWLTWQGYLLGPLGLGGKNGAWAFANLGVLIALALGFVVTFAFSRSAVRAEEAAPLPAPATV
jgi:hypothetical protein